jgi:hypothetical protein
LWLILSLCFSSSFNACVSCSTFVPSMNEWRSRGKETRKRLPHRPTLLLLLTSSPLNLQDERAPLLFLSFQERERERESF